MAIAKIHSDCRPKQERSYWVFVSAEAELTPAHRAIVEEDAKEVQSLTRIPSGKLC
ncbi:MAG: hypothetical protein LJE65_01025 [Desulfobacteraceae bacterium]|nr:hypothetical protein [Desulfobacteraceae bacterium]